MRVWLMVLALVPAFVSCSKSESSTPTTPEDVTPETALTGPVPATPAAPAPVRTYRSDWRAVPDGASPAEFADVRQDGHRYPWLYDGGWRVAHREGGAVLEVPHPLQHPPEPLSFRRYTGTAFGPDGQLPRRYRIEAEARSLGGSMRFRGYGEVAIQAFYLSPTRYVEVLQTDEHLLLWEAQDAPPGTGKGWRQLAKVPNPRDEGQWLRFGAEIDLDSGEVVALLNGREVARARSALLEGQRQGQFTIRATGNREEWRWVEVREME